MSAARPEPDPVLGMALDAEPSDVGRFEQGTPASRWALARYLVGRAIAESLRIVLLIAALVVLGLAVLVGWAGSTFWAVVIVLAALGILALRAALGAVLRRLVMPVSGAAAEQRVRAIVADTRRDVLRELRRVGLPGRTWSLPLLAARLLSRRRREETLARLRTFRVENAVSRSRLDEVHLLLDRPPDRSGAY